MDQSTQSLTIPPEARAFLTQLLQDSGQLSLPDDVKEQMIQEMYRELDKRMTLNLLDHIPMDQVENFQKLVETTQDPSQIQAFIQEHVPNAAEVFIQTMDEFRTIYLNEDEKQAN